MENTPDEKPDSVAETNEDKLETSESSSKNISFSMSKKKLGIIVGAIAAAIVIIILVVVLLGMKASPFSAAVKTCDLVGNKYASLDSNGKGLFLDGKGEKSDGLAITDLVCVFSALNVPSSVIDRMDHTTSLMGAQTADFEGITVSWTYHPSNGLDVALATK